MWGAYSIASIRSSEHEGAPATKHLAANGHIRKCTCTSVAHRREANNGKKSKEILIQYNYTRIILFKKFAIYLGFGKSTSTLLVSV